MSEESPVDPKRIAKIAGGATGGVTVVFVLAQLFMQTAELRRDQKDLADSLHVVAIQSAATDARSLANEKGTDRQFADISKQLERVIEKLDRPLDERPRGRRDR